MARKLNTAEYWDKRSIDRSITAEQKAERYSRDIQKVYSQAETQLTKDINAIYRTYAKGEGIDVDKLLQKLSVEDTHAFWLKMRAEGNLEYITANYQARISRLEQIKGEVYSKVRSIANDESAIHTTAHTDTINTAYNTNAFDTAQGLNANVAFTGLNTKTLDTMLNNTWQGANYSQRIWGNTNLLATTVKDNLGSALLTGKAPARVTKEIAEQFNVARYIADRLVRTETNYFQNEAEAQSNVDMGLERYKFVATLDTRTSQVCQDHDDKVYLLKDRNTGVNFPPLHPNCRSTTRAYIGKEFEPETRTARDKDGKNVEVQNMSYRQWAQMNKVQDVQPSTPPVPKPARQTINVVEETKSGRVNITSKTVKKSALPVEPTMRGGVETGLASVLREGMNDVYQKYPQAFDRLDRVLVSKTMGRSSNLNGVYTYGGQLKNRTYVKNADGTFKLDDLGRRMVQGTVDVSQKISVRVPMGSNDLQKYSERVSDLNKRGWWSTQNPKAVMYHELGHSLEQTMNLQEAGLYKLYDDFVATPDKVYLLNDVREDYTSITKAMTRHKTAGDLVTETMKEAYPNDSMYSAVKKNVSEYAKKSHAETFAELFAKVMNGDDDVVTKTFEKKLNARLKELKLL